MLGFTDVDLRETRFYQDVYAEKEKNRRSRLETVRFAKNGFDGSFASAIAPLEQV
ncbi:hypothetical protein [Dactylococcopsis salina]|uniref:Uncharacterized protein n=1 Tax=Dactylococcopsis salina (strain PCC 8305) TaxID=13035 RepID=K9YQ83_DACS8|nr:hypothetical protein [Dactylococcopsis salina]AFZ49049.1 hypothetical protein Dacsa_0241 [Dactylococcopsis salina PCC 8305]